MFSPHLFVSVGVVSAPYTRLRVRVFLLERPKRACHLTSAFLHGPERPSGLVSVPKLGRAGHLLNPEHFFSAKRSASAPVPLMRKKN